jgi:hypothetical protein
VRTFVYVDGFNLYYRALRGTPYKWLDLKLFAASLLDPANHIVAIRYYTARVSGRTDPDEPKRQNAYLRALLSLPEISIHYGNFLPKIINRPLVSPIEGMPKYVDVHSTEEKGSDVNLAAHLLCDGWKGAYDVAVVVTADTDLVEPIRLVTKELKKPVGLICLAGDASKRLKEVVSFVRRVVPSRLAAAQFPDVVIGNNGKEIHKPAEWKQDKRKITCSPPDPDPSPGE